MASKLPALLDAYAAGAHRKLTRREHEALPIYTAAVAIYYDICDWGSGWRRISAWLLTSINVQSMTDSFCYQPLRTDLQPADTPRHLDAT